MSLAVHEFARQSAEKYQRLVRRGVPEDLRVELWAVLGVQDCSRPVAYEDLKRVG